MLLARVKNVIEGYERSSSGPISYRELMDLMEGLPASIEVEARMRSSGCLFTRDLSHLKRVDLIFLLKDMEPDRRFPRFPDEGAIKTTYFKGVETVFSMGSRSRHYLRLESGVITHYPADIVEEPDYDGLHWSNWTRIIPPRNEKKAGPWISMVFEQ